LDKPERIMDDQAMPDDANSFTVTRILTSEDIAQWEQSFAHAYEAVFAGEPYLESFTPGKAAGVFRMLTELHDHITLIAADPSGDILGFGIAVPLSTMKTIAPRLDGLVPMRQTYYLAELGVLPNARGEGVGRALVRHRIRLMDRERFSHVVLRVSDTENSSAAMYKSLDFEDMGVSMDVTRPRIDGSVRADQRHFLCRVISQVDVS
jgi:ribosomal protein S18 acetylase RimI-like enzyme